LKQNSKLAAATKQTNPQSGQLYFSRRKWHRPSRSPAHFFPPLVAASVTFFRAFSFHDVFGAKHKTGLKEILTE